MNSYFSVIFVLILAISSIAAVQAAEVRLDETHLVVAGVDDSLGLGAVDVVLQYGSDVKVSSVTALPGFLTVENIKNDLGMTVIAAISTDGKTGDVPVATVLTEGNGTVAISVRVLANTKGDPIPYANPTFTGTIPSGGSENPVETTTTTTMTPTPGGQSGSTGDGGASVTSETTAGAGEAVTATATATTGSTSLVTDTVSATATPAEPASSETPARESKSNATPLSLFVIIPALGLAFVTYRMVNKY